MEYIGRCMKHYKHRPTVQLLTCSIDGRLFACDMRNSVVTLGEEITYDPLTIRPGAPYIIKTATYRGRTYSLYVFGIRGYIPGEDLP